MCLTWNFCKIHSDLHVPKVLVVISVVIFPIVSRWRDEEMGCKECVCLWKREVDHLFDSFLYLLLALQCFLQYKLVIFWILRNSPVISPGVQHNSFNWDQTVRSTETAGKNCNQSLNKSINNTQNILRYIFLIIIIKYNGLSVHDYDTIKYEFTFLDNNITQSVMDSLLIRNSLDILLKNGKSLSSLGLTGSGSFLVLLQSDLCLEVLRSRWYLNFFQNQGSSLSM